MYKNQEENSRQIGSPPKQGLYDPQFEHDSCGVGMVVNVNGKKSHRVVEQALTVSYKSYLIGRGGAEPNTGDGAGIIIQTPDAFLRRKAERHGFKPARGPVRRRHGLSAARFNYRRVIEMHFETIIASEGQRVAGMAHSQDQ